MDPAIQALLVSPEESMSLLFGELFGEMGVAMHHCSDALHVDSALSMSKFEALILDFDNVDSGVEIVHSLRESSASKDAIVFAVASDEAARQSAFSSGANFAFTRPFARPPIRQALQTAYALMLHDRRRYFRCPLECPVKITRVSGEILQAAAINISANGMAVAVSVSLQPGEKLEVSFSVLDTDVSVKGFGTVVWDDKHGKAGMIFQCSSPETEQKLATWLNEQFYRRVKSCAVSRGE